MSSASRSRAGARRRRPETARLVALTREKLRALAEDLKQFVDKHDHRVARPRFTDREAGAWRQALALLAGRMEVFGPEMERGRGRRSPPPASEEDAVSHEAILPASAGP